MPIEINNRRPIDVCPDRNLSCVARQIHIIDQAQKEAILEASCITCGKEELGEQRLYNTRPIILYLDNGAEFTARITDPSSFFPPSPTLSGKEKPEVDENSNGCGCYENECTTNLFRVESVEGNCCLLRCLKIVEQPSQLASPQCPRCRLIPTRFCCTVDLNRFCGIQCFRDVYLRNLIDAD